MLKIILTLLISLISISCDDIKTITIKDGDSIEEPIPETNKPLLYRIIFKAKKLYMHINVISETNNPYISYCSSSDCPNSQLLISNLREKDPHLYVQKSILPLELPEGYIYIYSFDLPLKGKVIFSSEKFYCFR